MSGNNPTSYPTSTDNSTSSQPYMAGPLTPAQMASINDNLQPNLIAAVVIMTTASLVAMILRFISKRISGQRIAADDYLISVGYMFALATIATCALGIQYGLGKHSYAEPFDPTMIESGLKDALASEILYVVAMCFIKISVLVFYCRIFVTKQFRYACYAIGTFIILQTVAAILATLLQCIPLEGFWDIFSQDRKCINSAVLFTCIGSLNAFTDALTLCLPIPYLWKLQLSTTRKLQLIAIFLSGSFATVISCIRAKFLGSTNYADANWSDVQPVIWTVVEVNAAIVAACLPLMRPLFDKKVRSRGMTTVKGGKSGTHTSTTGGSAQREIEMRNRKEEKRNLTRDDTSIDEEMGHSDGSPFDGTERKGIRVQVQMEQRHSVDDREQYAREGRGEEGAARNSAGRQEMGLKTNASSWV